MINMFEQKRIGVYGYPVISWNEPVHTVWFRNDKLHFEIRVCRGIWSVFRILLFLKKTPRSHKIRREQTWFLSRRLHSHHAAANTGVECDNTPRSVVSWTTCGKRVPMSYNSGSYLIIRKKSNDCKNESWEPFCSLIKGRTVTDRISFAYASEEQLPLKIVIKKHFLSRLNERYANVLWAYPQGSTRQDVWRCGNAYNDHTINGMNKWNEWKEDFIVVYISGSNEITSGTCRETGSAM